MSGYWTFSVGNLELQWFKMELNNYSKLFLESDLSEKTVNSFNEYSEPTELKIKCFTAKLIDVLPRLELSGYTLNGCKLLFLQNLKENYQLDSSNELITFEEYISCLSYVNIKNINYTEEEFSNLLYGDFDYDEFSLAILQNEEFRKGNVLKSFEDDGQFFANLDPLITLRLLMLNKSNHDCELCWNLTNILENQNCTEDELYTGPENKFVIVTEGSTDSFIIEKSFKQIRPDIAEFFKFIDMKKNYPFSGTGQICNFAKGLIKIGYDNHIIFIFDNDHAGVSKYEETLRIAKGSNLLVMKLPDLNALMNIKCFSACGSSFEYRDINGNSVAIEGFLDFAFEPNHEPTIQLSNSPYLQGCFINKTSYLKHFKKSHKKPEYNYEKMNYLLDRIFTVAVSKF